MRGVGGGRSADRNGEKGRKEMEGKEGKEGNNEERKGKEPVSDRL